MTVKKEKIAKRYARALFDATDPAQYQAVSDFLSSAASCWNNSGDFKNIAELPLLSNDKRAEVIAKVLGEVHPFPTKEIGKLIALLSEAHRVDVLPGISQFFTAYMQELQKFLALEVASARDLSEDERKKISEDLAKRLGSKVTVEWKVDSGLIGGLVIKAGDRMIDSSVRGALKQLESYMVNA